MSTETVSAEAPVVAPAEFNPSILNISLRKLRAVTRVASRTDARTYLTGAALIIDKERGVKEYVATDGNILACFREPIFTPEISQNKFRNDTTVDTIGSNTGIVFLPKTLQALNHMDMSGYPSYGEALSGAYLRVENHERADENNLTKWDVNTLTQSQSPAHVSGISTCSFSSSLTFPDVARVISSWVNLPLEDYPPVPSAASDERYSKSGSIHAKRKATAFPLNFQLANKIRSAYCEGMGLKQTTSKWGHSWGELVLYPNYDNTSGPWLLMPDDMEHKGKHISDPALPFYGLIMPRRI